MCVSQHACEGQFSLHAPVETGALLRLPLCSTLQTGWPEGFWRLLLILPHVLLQGGWDYRCVQPPLSFTPIPGIELRLQACVVFSLAEPSYQPTEGNFDLV